MSKPYTEIKRRLIVGALPGTDGFTGRATALQRNGVQFIILASSDAAIQAAATTLGFGELDAEKNIDATLVSSKQLKFAQELIDDEEI